MLARARKWCRLKKRRAGEVDRNRDKWKAWVIGRAEIRVQCDDKTSFFGCREGSTPRWVRYKVRNAEARPRHQENAQDKRTESKTQRRRRCHQKESQIRRNGSSKIKPE